MKIKYRLLGKYYRLKEYFYNNIAPKLPKIPTKKPTFPGMSDICKRCKTDIKIYAYFTGDGWEFFWDCENQHLIDFGEDEYIIVGWFPFLFGWATSRDLAKIGIIEV